MRIGKAPGICPDGRRKYTGCPRGAGQIVAARRFFSRPADVLPRNRSAELLLFGHYRVKRSRLTLHPAGDRPAAGLPPRKESAPGGVARSSQGVVALGTVM